MRDHGTRTRYVAGCRCADCRAASTDYNRHRRRQIAYGRWVTYVDAEPAREHVRMLQQTGLGWKRIAHQAGMSPSTMWKLLYGVPSLNRSPSQRIRPETEAALLAVDPSLDIMGATVFVDATGTHRRLQALMVGGWSMAKLAMRLGVEPTNLPGVMHRTRVRAATARAVRDLFDELWDQAPPTDGPRARQSAVRARNYARARGWVPAAAWDNIDDPTETPAVGEPTGSRPAAIVEDVDWLVSQGVSEAMAANQLGVRRATINTYRRRLDREAA